MYGFACSYFLRFEEVKVELGGVGVGGVGGSARSPDRAPVSGGMNRGLTADG